MTVQKFLLAVDEFSTWVGKAAAWLIILLMTVVCVEVFKRYIMNMPTAWNINEHSNVTAEGPPVYHFKTVIPIAGALILVQGIAEIVRCVVCLRTGEWPERLADVAEIDVIEEQLAHSEYVDEESRKIAIEGAQKIDEIARQRGMGGDMNT
jgi:TRAP-type mannitol/chloroaromatic compound transport system permease small subunit